MNRNATLACRDAVSSMRAYLEGELDADQRAALLEHINVCPTCRDNLTARQQVISALNTAYDPIKISESFDNSTNNRLNKFRKTPQQAQDLPIDSNQEEEDALLAGAVQPAGANFVLSAAPWWLVSVMLHVLVIALAGLVSMSMALPKADDVVVVVTELQPRTELNNAEQEKPKSELKNALESKHETPPTDPTSKEASDIVVPPEILAKAELGDHFETINPDRPDTQSAFGNPDSHMFYSVKGCDEPEGGGGTGGVSLEDVIGIGGASSPGTGGGWGGGHGTGIGVGNGSGRGSFGNRNGGGRRLMVKRHGGSRATENAVDKALEWLARHQEADGHWDCQKYEGKADARCQGINGDAAVTGFALLAFLGAGHTTKVGKYRDNVQRGLYWMMQKLDECEKDAGPGRYCKNHGSNYTQGVAALALAEAAGMVPNDGDLKLHAQKAMDGVIAGQIKTGGSEYQAWDYQPGGMTNDTSVTGWNIMALKSGKIAGLKIDTFAFIGAMNWINAGQDLKGAPAKAGEAEYWEGGMMTYRGTLANPDGRKNMAMTAAATLTRLMVGGEKPDVPGIAGPCNLMKKPENLPNKWPGNLYYWYYAALTMFQKGGDHWKQWNEPMKKTLPECQRKDGDMDGSWDPLFTEDTGYIYGGRVMSTSLGALCMEVYYRYQKLDGR